MAISLLQYQAQTQDPMAKGLVDRVTNQSIFMKYLKFIPVDGLAYSYTLREALPGIGFRGLNQNYTEQPSVLNPQVEAMAIFGGPVQTDAILYDRQGDIARANEIEGTVLNAGLFFDRNVIKGDPAVYPMSFYGLNARISTSGIMYQTCGANGGALTTALIDYLIDSVVGGNGDKLIVCNKAVRRNITELARTVGKPITYDTATGQVMMWNGVKIEVLDEDGDQVPILAENETMGSSSVTTSMYCLKLGGTTDKQFLQGLVGTNASPGSPESGTIPGAMGGSLIVHRDVGLLGTYYLDIIEMLGGIAMFHPRAAGRLAGIIPQ